MDSNQKITEIRVDGGASKNNLLLKFQSDVSNRTIRRSKVIETTVLGAAFMSGLGSGFWKSLEEIENHIGADSLGYLYIENTMQATKQNQDSLCTACFTGIIRLVFHYNSIKCKWRHRQLTDME